MKDTKSHCFTENGKRFSQFWFSVMYWSASNVGYPDISIYKLKR